MSCPIKVLSSFGGRSWQQPVLSVVEGSRRISTVNGKRDSGKRILDSVRFLRQDQDRPLGITYQGSLSRIP